MRRSVRPEPKRFDKLRTLTIRFVGSTNASVFTYDEILNYDERGVMYIHNSHQKEIYAINFNNAMWWSVKDEETEENNNESVTDCE